MDYEHHQVSIERITLLNQKQCIDIKFHKYDNVIDRLPHQKRQHFRVIITHTNNSFTIYTNYNRQFSRSLLVSLPMYLSYTRTTIISRYVIPYHEHEWQKRADICATCWIHNSQQYVFISIQNGTEHNHILHQRTQGCNWNHDMHTHETQHEQSI